MGGIESNVEIHWGLFLQLMKRPSLCISSNALFHYMSFIKDSASPYKCF